MGELILVLLMMAVVGLGYEVLYSFNCGSQTEVQTPLLTFNSDKMYEGLKSKGLKKRSLPPKFKDPADIELLTHERTTGGDEFSYLLRLTGPDRYFLLLKFIEVVHEMPRQRLFEVRLGDEVVFEVDIVKEVGTDTVLNKWFQFQLVDDVLYLNQTVPVLNGYIYPKQILKFTLGKVIGQPKIESLVLVKGADSEIIREHLELERVKLEKRQDSTCQRYQKPVTFPYKHMTGKEHFDFPDSSLTYYLDGLLSFNTVLSVVAVAFVVMHEKIYGWLNLPREKKEE